MAQTITAQYVSDVTSTSATVHWITCAGASNSQVRYGTTTAYGAQTTVDSTMVTSHAVPLTGLTTGVLYHYQVVSVDASGIVIVGLDQTFTAAGFAAPSVTSSPSNATVCNGAIASFTAAASGTPAPSVQWKVSTDGGSTYSNIAGATSATYSFTALASQTGYKYEAVFTNASGSATSSVATLTVNTLPVASTQPLSQSVVAGATATFTAAGSGSPGPTVQWQQSTDGGTTWANVPSATSTTLTLTGTTTGQNGFKYRAVFTNSCGSVNSAAVTLTVTPATTWNISSTSNSDRSSGAFLQGQSLSGTKYVFSSLATSATSFSLSGITKTCFWLDDVAMAGPPVGCVFASPFDFNAGSTIPTFVQSNSATPKTPTSPVTVQFTKAQTAGNMNIVVVGRSNTTSGVNSVVDSKGNTYTLISARSGSIVRQSIYYAKNIQAATAGANTVTVTFDSAPPFPDVRILEYSGLDQTSPSDTDIDANGTAALADSGLHSIALPNELLVGAGTTSGQFTGPGSGYTSRMITPDGDIVEDKNVTALGNYNAQAPVTPFAGSSDWVMQMATFKAATAILGWDTTKATNGTHTITQVVTPISGAPETDTSTFTVNNSVGHSAVLSWTKGTATNGVTYNVYRQTGACGSSFSGNRIASGLGGTSYTDSTVLSGTSYCFAVTQVDSVNALQSVNSNLVTATIP